MASGIVSSSYRPFFSISERTFLDPEPQIDLYPIVQRVTLLVRNLINSVILSLAFSCVVTSICLPFFVCIGLASGLGISMVLTDLFKNCILGLFITYMQVFAFLGLGLTLCNFDFVEIYPVPYILI